MNTLYDTLGVSKEATEKDLLRAYQRQSARNTLEWPKLANQFQEVQKAYDILANPLLRKRYDDLGIIPMKDLYSTLEIAKDASEEEIRKAHRHMVAKCHPDKHGNSPESQKQFRKVQEAYELLIDPTRRKKYNRFGTVSEPRKTTSQTHDNQNIQQDLLIKHVRVGLQLSNLMAHNLKHGTMKNALLVGGSVFLVVLNPGWWSGAFVVAVVYSMVWSAKSWLGIIYDPLSKND